MNNWFLVKVKYTKQLEDGTFKRVSEPYLLSAMTFTDAEARIYEELGNTIRGEFTVLSINRFDLHDIFHYEDADTWYKCKITYEAASDNVEEGGKAKKISHIILVSAHSVKEATERLNESLKGMMMDYTIPSVSISPIVDIFPFCDNKTEDEWLAFDAKKITEGTIVDVKLNGVLIKNLEYEGENTFLADDDSDSFTLSESDKLVYKIP